MVKVAGARAWAREGQAVRDGRASAEEGADKRAVAQWTSTGQGEGGEERRGEEARGGGMAGQSRGDEARRMVRMLEQAGASRGGGCVGFQA